MPRQLRIEYPGAFYHVYSRGNQKQPIFFSDDDRYYYLNILRQAHERLGCISHLYCLMDSHYHLTLETPDANLSQIMHFINSAYSVYLNKKHERCGHLFQGRFKAILVQADAYARTLATYIHGNPVRIRNGFIILRGIYQPVPKSAIVMAFHVINGFYRTIPKLGNTAQDPLFNPG